MEKIKSPNDACKDFLTSGIVEIAKASRGIAPGPHKGGGRLTAPHMNPQLQWPTY